ncbi:hypothetical protein [Liquorilactobacillus mali]|uniref:Uncharacterized protein n=1 Tax=Liquorilactobacillus mali KCTC 3596 = DSM 20444 TaxID=1046596 RepID=A0A0R2E596_9LACO|nr:hypothetical protein [Liquorilactobacillus mali]KRN10803.1 hypothetical protein FD00_GL002045 [Liquorilactobacillus mali KCTC 3596 = DSM 20444]
MTMTYEQLAEKLKVAKDFRESFVEWTKDFYEAEYYYNHCTKYAKKNNIAIEEDAVKQHMFDKLYEIADSRGNEYERCLIADMAWDLCGDNQPINYGIGTVEDIFDNIEIFLEANKKVAEIARKETNVDEDTFSDESNDYLTDNWSEMYDMLKNNK